MNTSLLSFEPLGAVTRHRPCVAESTVNLAETKPSVTEVTVEKVPSASTVPRLDLREPPSRKERDRAPRRIERLPARVEAQLASIVLPRRLTQPARRAPW